MKMPKYTRTIATLLVTASISFTAALIYKQSPMYDDRETILEMLIKYPNVFKVSKERRTQIIEQRKICSKLNKSNFRNYNFGDSLSTSKEECLNSTIAKITEAMEYSQSMDSLKGHLVIHIGNLSNSFNAKYTLANELSNEQSFTYIRNIQTIISAIPKNIPNREVLIHFTIDNIRFFDDYAKIEFLEDAQIQKLDRKAIPYKGQF